MERISESLLTFLLNAAWQIVVITAIAALANHLIRKGPASHRHAVWAAALVAALLLPLMSVRKPEPTASLPVSISPALPAASAAMPESLASRTSEGASLPVAVPFSQTPAIVIVAVYFLFVLYRSVRFTKAWIKTIRIRSQAEASAIPPALERVWARCQEAFGITRVEFLVSPEISSPVTLGAIRPAVIIPEDFWKESSEDVLSAAIGHELAHIARRDFAVNLLYELIYLPISFHPACLLIRREIERTREMACDEAVTSRLLEPRVYAHSIMKIASALTKGAEPGYTLGVFDGNVLEQRIRRLLERPRTSLKRARLLLAASLSALLVCVFLASTLALTALPQSAIQTQMKLAGDAYNSGDFKSAVGHFTTAVTLQPSNVNAKLFLANALMRHFYTAEGRPDTRLLDDAVQQYREVLARDPKNKQAIAGMTAITIHNKQVREAREWAEKLAAIDPNDKSVWYTLGFLNWMIVFPEYQRAKQASGGKPEEYLIADANVRKNLRDQYLPQVESGLQSLERSLLLDPDYHHAMAYMNLLLRLKAGLVDDRTEATNLMAKADEWISKTLEARKSRASGPGAAIEKLDVEGPPPGPAGVQTVRAPMPPPPPPPPPPANKVIR